MSDELAWLANSGRRSAPARQSAALRSSWQLLEHELHAVGAVDTLYMFAQLIRLINLSDGLSCNFVVFLTAFVR